MHIYDAGVANEARIYLCQRIDLNYYFEVSIMFIRQWMHVYKLFYGLNMSRLKIAVYIKVYIFKLFHHFTFGFLEITNVTQFRDTLFNKTKIYSLVFTVKFMYFFAFKNILNN